MSTWASSRPRCRHRREDTSETKQTLHTPPSRYFIADAGGGNVDLISGNNGKYVSADPGAGGALKAGWATAIYAWATFKFTPIADGWNGIVAVATGLLARSPCSDGPMEPSPILRRRPVIGGTFALRSCRCRHASAHGTFGW
jgi:hypothetical protein